MIMVERGVVTNKEIDEELFGSLDVIHQPKFSAGDLVRVKQEDSRVRWRKPHLRCPGYIFGLQGVVQTCVGCFDDPYLQAFRSNGPKQPLYRVLFTMKDIWGSCYYSDNDSDCKDETDDSVVVDISQPWLEHCTEMASHSSQVVVEGEHEFNFPSVQLHPDSSHHDDDNEGHIHLKREETESHAVLLEGPDTPGRQVGDALMRILERKSIITQEQLNVTVDYLDNFGERLAGADLVVRAWLDSEFKDRLLNDAASAAQEVGILVSNPNAATVLIVVENTSKVHNLVVCTLCPCYPSALLGLSPAWYKSRSYRSRAVREPRAVLREFGTCIPSSVKIIVHDSTADCRFLVLPMRPENTIGWDEEKLRSIVTRDSMIGVKVLSI